MPALFVLDVPEFAAIVTHARATPGFHVSGPVQGYYKVAAQPKLVLNRKALAFKPAVWHGAMTGGFIGRIEQFDNDMLILVDEAAS